jgi:hypothetical protein
MSSSPESKGSGLKPEYARQRARRATERAPLVERTFSAGGRRPARSGLDGQYRAATGCLDVRDVVQRGMVHLRREHGGVMRRAAVANACRKPGHHFPVGSTNSIWPKQNIAILGCSRPSTLRPRPLQPPLGPGAGRVCRMPPRCLRHSCPHPAQNSSENKTRVKSGCLRRQRHDVTAGLSLSADDLHVVLRAAARPAVHCD